MSVKLQYVCFLFLFFYNLNSVEYRPQRIHVDQSHMESNDRSSTSGSPGVEEAAISILIKVKIFPFRKPKDNLNRTLETARFGGPYTGVGDLAGDNGVFGAGVDFGLPDGSGFGYGEDRPFKTFSLSQVSFFFK